jgi:hypothetical protein
VIIVVSNVAQPAVNPPPPSGNQVLYVSNDGHTTNAATWTHSVEQQVSNGYFVVFWSTNGNYTPTITLNGAAMSAIATRQTWSDGGTQTIWAWGTSLATVPTGSYSFVMTGSTSTERSAQSFLFSNVGSVEGSSRFIVNAAWSDPVAPPANGRVIHFVGGRIASAIDYGAGYSLWTQNIAGTTRNKLYAQTTETATTFSAPTNGRGQGRVTVLLNPS